MIVSCKACGKEVQNKNGGALTCEGECRLKNRERIKKEYYLRNLKLCRARAKKQRENGYKWIPSEEKKQAMLEKQRKHYRKTKAKNPAKLKEYYQKSNNKKSRKEYMKNYAKNEKNVEKLKANAKKYKLKNTTKEIRYTDHYKRRYGIIAQDYDMMEMNQMGLCKICKKPESRNVKGKLTRLAVDHCHKTGKVRGLLCFRCNSTLGRMEESVDLMRSFIQYIEQSSIDIH